MIIMIVMSLVLKKSKRRNKWALINASFNGGHHNARCATSKKEKNDIPVLQNLDVRWPIMHFTFYLMLLSTPFATNEQRLLRYPALVTRDAVNELRGCVTYNQRSKWGLARRPRRRQIGTKRSHAVFY